MEQVEPRKRGRPRKIVEIPENELIDTSTMSKEEIAQQLRNKIFTLAMLPDPSAQVLVLATKVFDVEGVKEKEVEELSTEEIMERLGKLG